MKKIVLSFTSTKDKMGIKGFGEFLKQRGLSKGKLSVYKYADLSEFANLVIAFDVSIYIYKFLSRAVKEVTSNSPSIEEITKIDRNLVIETCIGYFEDFVQDFLNYSITPIFVLDGVAPVEKDATKAKRRVEHNKKKDTVAIAEAKIGQCSNDESERKNFYNLRKHYTASINFTWDEQETIVEGLKKIEGIMVIRARGEAEMLASQLARDGLVDIVMTKDSDVLLYGAPFVICDIHSRGPSQVAKYRTCERVYRRLGFTREQFVEFAIMCGLDHNQNIKGIGPVKCYALIQKYGSIDNIPVGEEVIVLTGKDGLRKTKVTIESLEPLNHIRMRELIYGPIDYDVLHDDINKKLVTNP